MPLDPLSIVGSWASIVGLLGLVIAYVQLRRTRKASEAATRAVEQFREDIHQVNCLSDLTKALAGIEELKRLLRSKNYQILLVRLADVRHTLISVRGSSNSLSPNEQTILQEAIASLRNIETKIDDVGDGEITNRSTLKAIEGLIQRADSLHELMIRLRNQIGGQNHDLN